MKKQEESKLTEEFKLSKNPSVIPSIARDLEKAVAILRSGGVVIFPTDTVYGIGCRFDMPKAVARIKNIKNTSQNFPILIANVSQAYKLAEINTTAQSLINKYWPGALTIILKSKSGHGKIGLRLPDSDILKEIINKLGIPIVGTSANFHTKKTVARFDELDPRLLKLVDFVLKGDCEIGRESTVIDATTHPPKVLRKGATPLQ